MSRQRITRDDVCPTILGLEQSCALYVRIRRVLDVGLAGSLVPVLLMVTIGLAVLNPFYNRGPLFIRQKRMGKDCAPIWIWKFRTMADPEAGSRAPDATLEIHRITPLGRLLRRFRLDEIPQIINILGGDMSFIGPRPDLWEHAVYFSETVRGYQMRHTVLPGLTGLAQVTLGYAEGVYSTLRKTRRDLLYIKKASITVDTWILVKTVGVVIGGLGK